MTPMLKEQLLQMVEPLKEQGRFRLSLQTVFDSLEKGSSLDTISSFLSKYHDGPLPAAVTDWLTELKAGSVALRQRGNAILVNIKVSSLVTAILEDPQLSKFCKPYDVKTIVVPTIKIAAFRKRVKDMGYVLL